VFRAEYATNNSMSSLGGNDDFVCNGLTHIRQVDVASEGAVMKLEHFNTGTESMLVYATQKGLIHGWDLRARREV
jgi:hypothetical protein